MELLIIQYIRLEKVIGVSGGVTLRTWYGVYLTKIGGNLLSRSQWQQAATFTTLLMAGVRRPDSGQ